jgi:2-dehydropantoate 2-reductase
MRWIIYGAGAVGGVIGARLAQQGHDVVLIARGQHLTAIQQAGLVLKTPNERVTLPITAVASPRAIDWRAGDVVMLAMKTQDTEPALAELALCVPRRTPIVCAQNGVENERLALRRFEHVYATCVALPATHLEAGVVQANSAAMTGILDTGCYPNGTDAFAGELCSILSGCGFSARPSDVIMRWKYAKLLMNLGNAFQAACGDADGRDILREARAEAVACYRAARIDCASDDEDRERRGDLIRLKPIDGQRRGGGSTWQSLARGQRTTEADYLNGEIALLGALHGVPTPVNRVLRRVANRLAANGSPPACMSVAELAAEIDADRARS